MLRRHIPFGQGSPAVAALAAIVVAWCCQLYAVATRDTRLAADALYYAELAAQRQTASMPARPPTVESIATEVHRRAVRQLAWVGAGLAACAVAAIAARWRLVAVAASCGHYLGGWLLLGGYLDVGLFLGLDLKLRMLRGESARVLEFMLFDGVLPLVVAATGLASIAVPLRRLLRTR